VQQQPPRDAITATLVPEPVETTTVADVIIGALGLTGALVVAALVLGLLLGGTLIAIKKFRARYNLEPIPDSESLRITPQ
jgi:hypothetical protein